MAQRALTPAYWQHEQICDRRRCREAAREALAAVEAAREMYDGLVAAMATRTNEDSQFVPVGWRSDSMASIDLEEDGEWWATGLAKRRVVGGRLLSSSGGGDGVE